VSAVLASAEAVQGSRSSGGGRSKEGREREMPIAVREEKEGRSVIIKERMVVLRRKRATRGQESGEGPNWGGKRAFHLGWLTEP